MLPGFPQRKNVSFNRACSCCLIAAAYNCCEVATCFWALSVELLARSLVPGGGHKVFLVSNSVDYAWFDTSKEQIWRLQRGCSRLFLNVFPALLYKTSGLHQYEAFGFQILHSSYPCLYLLERRKFLYLIVVFLTTCVKGTHQTLLVIRQYRLRQTLMEECS